MSVSTKITYTKAFAKLRGLGTHRAHAGVHDDGAAYADGVRVIEVAIWNHFGTSNIPARPFITATLEAKRGELKTLYVRLTRAVIEGKMSDEAAAEFLGQWATREIVSGINAGFPPPNAESTIARKGSDLPLVDTGQLKASIRATVDRVK